MFSRICKNCSGKISYKTIYNFKNAEKNESLCRTCSSSINGKNNKNRICSDETKNKIKQSSQKISAFKKNGYEVPCYECGKLKYRSMSEIKLEKKLFCSKLCANKNHSKLLTKHEYKVVTCQHCGNEFKQTFSRKKFCGIKCSSRSNLKIINSKEPKKVNTKPEILFLEILKNHNIEFIHQKRIQWKNGWVKWFDFYLPKYNLLIEIDGCYWHGKNIKTKDLNKQQWNTRVNDRLKNIIAKKRGYSLVRLWSDELELVNLKNILESYENISSD
jgi:very-short-patch-repair endonuclease